MHGAGARRENGDFVYSVAGHENAKATPNMASVLFSEQQPISIAIRVLVVATVRQLSTILHWAISHYNAVATHGGKMGSQTN